MSKENRFDRGNKDPKYPRYFLAYSDKMIRASLSKADYTLSELLMLQHSSLVPEPESELIEIELPLTSGDRNGKYGVLILPEDYVGEFMSRGPKHKSIGLAPRVLNPQEGELVYLRDRSLRLSSEPNEYPDNYLLPYRIPNLSKDMPDLLGERGYRAIVSSEPYIATVNGRTSFFTELGECGVKSAKFFPVEQKPRINIYRIVRNSLRRPVISLANRLDVV